ncbi:unnamed protein product [Withania somnifera]
MVFFFVGGLEQQARQVLKGGVGRCIAFLKLFFVPVWRWPGKEPVMYCNDCKLFFPQSLTPPSSTTSVPDVLRCQFCRREVDADF